MRYEVVVSQAAARDLAEIRAYLIEEQSLQRAEQVLTALRDLLATLADMPHRGNVPKEMALLGTAGPRELHWQSYRMVYEVTGSTVAILAVADGRRDMREFLRRRLER